MLESLRLNPQMSEFVVLHIACVNNHSGRFYCTMLSHAMYCTVPELPILVFVFLNCRPWYGVRFSKYA